MAIVSTEYGSWVVAEKAGKLPIGKEANWWNKKRKTPDKSLRNEKNALEST